MGVSSCVGTVQQQERQTNLTDMQEQEPRETRTLDLELDPGRLPGVSSWSLYMSSGAQTKPNHSHNENYMLWPILFKTSPALHSFSLPYHFQPTVILHPLVLGLVTARKSLIPHPLLWLLFPYPLSAISTRGLRRAPSTIS